MDGQEQDGDDRGDDEPLQIGKRMRALQETEGKVEEIRPIVRCDKTGDGDPHAIQRWSLVQDHESQAADDEDTQDRLRVPIRIISTGIADIVDIRAGAKVQVVERVCMVENQEAGERANDQPSDKE